MTRRKKFDQNAKFQEMDLVRDDYFGLGIITAVESATIVVRWVSAPNNNLARSSSGVSRIPLAGPHVTAWKSRLKFVCHG